MMMTSLHATKHINTGKKKKSLPRWRKYWPETIDQRHSRSLCLYSLSLSLSHTHTHTHTYIHTYTISRARTNASSPPSDEQKSMNRLTNASDLIFHVPVPSTLTPAAAKPSLAVLGSRPIANSTVSYTSCTADSRAMCKHQGQSKQT
jgi:hypothetical protein